MFSPSTSGIISRCWSRHFGWDEANGPLWSSPARVVPHGGELMNYHGVMAMDGPEGSVVSVPSPLQGELEPALLESGASPTINATRLPPDMVSMVLGPAYIGYAEVVTGSPRHQVQLLGRKDALAVASLQEACETVDWESGGSDLEVAPVACGVFAGETLVALAGYEIWDGTVAHISIVTHPGHRGEGFGRSAVAFLARHAQWKKLLPQYRTLEGNAPSMAIARSLGFEHFGTSVAVRFKRDNA